MRKSEKRELEDFMENQENNLFNSVTQKVNPENQNQQHNVKKEGFHRINQ